MANPNKFGEIDATIGKTLSLEGVACTITGTDADEAEGFQVLVPAGASKVLAYECDVASGVAEADYKDQTNVATATWGNGRTANSAVKSFDFALAAETDTEITVADDKYTDNNHVLGTVKLAESPKTFTYDVEWAGVAGKCTTFTNTATIDGDKNHAGGQRILGRHRGLRRKGPDRGQDRRRAVHPRLRLEGCQGSRQDFLHR